MKYEIRINEAKERNGTISLQRLALIAGSLRKISEGSLQIRLKGVSTLKGPKKIFLAEALNVTLTGIKEGSTCLEFETEPFSKTLGSFQLDVFRQESQNDLLHLTPFSLFMSAFQEAVKDEPSSDLLDKPLLRELKNYKKAFLSDSESMTITNQGSIDTVTLNNETFAKIKILEAEIPDPKPVILNGKVEMLKHSKQKVTIQTEEGMVDGFIGENVKPEEIGAYWGKEITIAGMAHFKPGSKTIIEIDRISEPSVGDDYFSKKPKSETIEQQITRQFHEGKKPNAIAELVGKWPGEETDEEFEQLIKEFK